MPNKQVLEGHEDHDDLIANWLAIQRHGHPSTAIAAQLKTPSLDCGGNVLWGSFDFNDVGFTLFSSLGLRVPTAGVYQVSVVLNMSVAPATTLALQVNATTTRLTMATGEKDIVIAHYVKLVAKDYVNLMFAGAPPGTIDGFFGMAYVAT